MDARAIRKAALITSRGAICQRFPPGSERELWLAWVQDVNRCTVRGASAMTGRFALPHDAKTAADLLAAVERLRLTMQDGRAIVADDLTAPSKAFFGVAADPKFVEELRENAPGCLATVDQSEK